MTPNPAPETESVEDFDPEKDIYVYDHVENQDWNLEMIHADSDLVKEAVADPKGPIRVALLDSGINESDEVFVTARKNFVPGQDDYSPLFEDVSGHGTAIAEVLASDPEGTEKLERSFADEDEESYEYAMEFNEGLEKDTVEYEDWEAQDEDGEEASLMDLFESGYEWNTGINPTVDLISAKVLDENNETTVEQVVEAINWAIENDSDIISMSFGMEKGCKKLHRAIKKASENGILLVASAGNGDTVEYPAAYPEVMAVGSVDSVAEQAEESASGEEIEVVAPGEFIVSRGWFDSMQIFSGSSMAVPHVVGLASLLWQKDTSKSAQFIRQLINSTAKNCGAREKYGFGLIDCEYALKQYDTFEQTYEENEAGEAEDNAGQIQEAGNVPDNETEIETFEEVRTLYGNWTEESHYGVFVRKNKPGVWEDITPYLMAIRKGTIFVDNQENSGCVGMNLHPWFHGYEGKDKPKKGFVKSNYIASYCYLAQLAQGMYEDGRLKLKNTDAKVFEDNERLKNAYDGINAAFADEEKIGSWAWEKISPYCKKGDDGSIPKKYRSLVLYGMALHTATDTYAHSSYCCQKKTGKKVKWKRLDHTDTVEDKIVGRKVCKADAPTIQKKRYQNAKQAAKKIMKKIVADAKGFHGYKKTVASPVNMFGTAYYDIDNYIMGNQLTKVLKEEYIKNAYALGNMYEYVSEMEALRNKEYPKLKKKAEKLALGKVKKKTNGFTLYKGKAKKQYYGVQFFSLVDNNTNKVMVKKKVTKPEDEFVIAVSKNSNCSVRATSTLNSIDKKCCTLSGGYVYDISGKIKENQETGEEMEEDAEDMCDAYTYDLSIPDDIRIELTWKTEKLDLDSVLAVMFPADNSFYLTYFYDKASHPELGDVFQADFSKASIDQDVVSGGETETTVIYNLEAGGCYLFSIRDYEESGSVNLKGSGAVIKVYQGNQKEPCYTAKVPDGDGYYWNAFMIDGSSWMIYPINTITDQFMG